MTSQAQLGLTRRFYAAFNASDADRLAEMFDPECEWLMGHMSIAAGREIAVGHAGLRGLLTELAEALSEFEFRMIEARATSRGTLEILVGADGKSSRMSFAGELPPYWQEIEFRGDRILRVTIRPDAPDDWESALPLPTVALVDEWAPGKRPID